jgi:predicted RNase H-like nuclease
VRACDVEARRLLGRRGVTVFAAPVRPVLGCVSYAEARALLAERGDRSMSAQAWGIVRAVRDVDAVVNADDEARVVEAHPEVAFLAMTGAALAGKKTPEGRRARVEALRGGWPSVDAAVADAPARAGSDDVLDALACAWVARRWADGVARTLGDGERDARGLAMRIAT